MTVLSRLARYVNRKLVALFRYLVICFVWWIITRYQISFSLILCHSPLKTYRLPSNTLLVMTRTRPTIYFAFLMSFSFMAKRHHLVNMIFPPLNTCLITQTSVFLPHGGSKEIGVYRPRKVGQRTLWTSNPRRLSLPHFCVGRN